MDKIEIMRQRLAAIGGTEQGNNIFNQQEHFKYYAKSSPGYREFVIDDTGICISVQKKENFPLKCNLISDKTYGFLFTKSSSGMTEVRFKTLYDISVGGVLWFSNRFWVVTERDYSDSAMTTGKIKQCVGLLNFEVDGVYYTIPYFTEKNSISVDIDQRLAYSDKNKTFKMPFTEQTQKLKVNKRIMDEVIGGVPNCWEVVGVYSDNGILCVEAKSSPYNENTDDIGLMLCDFNKVLKVSESEDTAFSQVMLNTYEPLYVKKDERETDTSLFTGENSIVKDVPAVYTSTEDVIWDIQFVGAKAEDGSDVGAILSKTKREITIIGISPGKYIIITATAGEKSSKKQILIKNM